MKKLTKLIIIIMVALVSVFFSLSYILKNLNFGLDLIGGFEVLYQVEPLDTDNDLTTDMLNATAKSLINRIDTLGVSEPVIKVEGNKVRVQLAGVKDLTEARNRLSTPAVLTFRDVNDNLLMSADVLKSGGAKLDYKESQPVVSLGITDTTKFAQVTEYISQLGDDNNKIVIWLDFEEGKDSYANTLNEVGRSTCGYSGNSCISVASVSQSFASDVIIQGSFKETEAQNLVDLINSGSLPTKLSEISSKNVDADFGANTLSSTFKAGIISTIILIAFLCIIYHVSGLITSISLMIYTTLVFWTFYLIEGVLTLPGIAALVIGIGMAVDASVISYSRIKEELDKGSSLEKAFIDGKKNSYSSIIDGNLTTLIVAIILYIFGESSVQGFATLLILSIVITMLSIVLINNLLIKLCIKTGLFNNHLNLLLNYRKDKKKKQKSFDLISKRKYVYAFYIICIIVGVSSLFINKLNLGIDFTGGSSISVVSDNEIDLDKVNEIIQNNKYTITNSNLIGDNKEAYVTIKETLTDNEVTTINTLISSEIDAKCSISGINDIVKKELVKNAIMSVIIACIGIIIYVTFRYKFNYGICGLIALFMDVFFIITIFSIFKLQVNVIFIAALLAIIGYSINDTIVFFDRIRENNIKTKNLKDSINTSLSQTYVRNIITSITTIIPVVILLIVTSSEITNFNIAMLIGLVEGSFSSLLLSPCILYDIEKRQEINAPKKKKHEFHDELDEMSIKGINS